MMRWTVGFILTSLLSTLVVAAAEPAMPMVVLAKDENLDKAIWGETVKVDEQDARILKAGATGIVPLALWWVDGLRPAEGVNAAAEIRFKDTASTPIRVDVFAGLPGRYEVHRIGGLGDNQWKTARVPLPWDMVMRLPGTARTELYLSAPAGNGVPVASITLAKGEPEKDEAAWAAETRAWIARAQSEKRAAAKIPAPDGEAVLPEAFKDKPAVPFARSYERMIAAGGVPRHGEAGATVKVRMATNEIEPAQFGIYASGTDLKDVRVTIAPDGLTGAAGKLEAQVELFAAEYSALKNSTLFPQRLWPAYAVDIPKGRAHAYWINISGDAEKTKPGSYKGRIVIEANGAPAGELPLEVEVLPLKLLSMSEANLDLGGCVTGLLPAHELRLKTKHNHNSINLWASGFMPKIIRKSATEFDLDFTIPDEFMKHAKAAGIRSFVYFLGGDPYGAPDTFNLQRELYRQVHYSGADQMEGRKEFLRCVTASPEQMLPELRALYVQWVKKLMSHAKEAGWPEPLLTPFDEPAKWVQNQNVAQVYYYKNKDGRDAVDKIKPKDQAAFLEKLKTDGITPEALGQGGAGKWINPQFKQACAAIHEAWPEARIYGSIHHADSGLPFLPDIEVFCTNAIHEDYKLGDKVRAGGPKKTFWQYSGGGDSAEPSQGRYNFGVFFAAFDSRGSLCWAYNWGQRFDTSTGDNWLYAWTTPYSIVRAPFWEGMREAWDDRRYIETLRAEAKKAGPEQEKAAAELLEGIFQAAVAKRTAGGRDTVHDFWARSNDPEALAAQRAKIVEMLLKLQK